MASVKVNEDDIPGGKFIHSCVPEHTNTQLKRWLYCHGLNTGGKREDLIQRCQTALKAKVDIDPSVDQGKWYELKSAEISTSDESVPILPVTGWKAFPSNPSGIPAFFNNGSVYHYLVESVSSFNVCNEECEKDIHTSKDYSKGKKLFHSGHVKYMQDASSNDFYFVKCKVQASMDTKEVYMTTVTMSKRSGVILEGTCPCKGCCFGRCSHVAALLIAIDDYVSKFGRNLTCTEIPCEWNKGRKSGKNPLQIFNKNYQSVEGDLKRPRKKKSSILQTDPRPAQLQEDNITTSEFNGFISNLHQLGDCGWSNLLDFKYDDFTIEDYGKEILHQQCEILSHNLKSACAGKEEPFCFPGTENQSAEEEWRIQRRCRVTASNAKQIACLKSGQEAVVKKQLWDTDSVNAQAILYGQKNEKNAVEEYQKQHTEISVSQTGLWVNPDHPELGASPDAVLYDRAAGKSGLLEVKCPFVLKDCQPSAARENLSSKQLNNFCCEVETNGKLRLKHSHQYYFQVQMQLGVCDASFCDFVIWSPIGMSVERITFDETLWANLVPKLKKFHREYLAPELFLQRLPRQLPIAQFVE